MMPDSHLTAMLQRDEGYRSQPYKDTTGHLSIGFGRNLDANGIRPDEARLMLRNDIAEAKAEAKKFTWYAGLNRARKDVVVMMLFNLGWNSFITFTNTIRAISEGRFEDASAGMLASKWAFQVGKRANKLAEMMREGKYP
jgi:lysozyme